MPTGQQLIHWTIRLALVCFTLFLAGKFARRAWTRDFRGRWLWTLGCVVFIIHVYFAFRFHHHWNYQHALDETADATQRLIGVRFGQGILFSYLFLLVWLGDVVWWWTDPDRYLARPTWLTGVLFGYLLFIAVNGAIIFEAGVTRPAGLLACLVLGYLAWRNRRSDRFVRQSTPSKFVSAP